MHPVPYADRLIENLDEIEQEHVDIVNSSEIRYVNGRRLELHFDGHKLRLVAWRWRGNVYWVSNTLSLNLTNAQMIGIAASMTHA